MKQGEKLLAVCSVSAVLILAGAGLRRHLNERAAQAELEAVTNYKFPVAELAALDRDVQARFAVVPAKWFGLSRVGPTHGLYQPHTWPEKQTVKALKKRGYEVAFFVMSRRTYKDEYGAYGRYPIQGPVHVTSPRSGPQPRWKQFQSAKTEFREGVTIRVPYEPLELSNPQGTPVPTTVAEGHLPDKVKLMKFGTEMFRLSEKVSADKFMGDETTLSDGWKVSATTIRANKPACLQCHERMKWAYKEERKYQLGDAFGIAMYAFRKSPENGAS